MKAIVIEKYGNIHEMRVATSLPALPGDHDVLIRIHATAVNPVDWKVRAGLLSALPFKFPLVLGWDLSGVVEAVGMKVTTFIPGDEVFCFPPVLGGQGTYATHISLPEDIIAKKPATLSHLQTAALPLSGLTAWQGLFEHGELRRGHKVFILGASGGVGVIAVQLASSRGAYVTGCASGANLPVLLELGAHQAFDYCEDGYLDKVGKVDLILDCVGGKSQSDALRVLKPGGRLVSILEIEKQTTREMEGTEHTAVSFLTRPSRRDLESLAALVDGGLVRPLISQLLSINDVRKAHAMIETGHTLGKIVLKVIDESFSM